MCRRSVKEESEAAEGSLSNEAWAHFLRRLKSGEAGDKILQKRLVSQSQGLHPSRHSRSARRAHGRGRALGERPLPDYEAPDDDYDGSDDEEGSDGDEDDDKLVGDDEEEEGGGAGEVGEGSSEHTPTATPIANPSNTTSTPTAPPIGHEPTATPIDLTGPTNDAETEARRDTAEANSTTASQATSYMQDMSTQAAAVGVLAALVLVCWCWCRRARGGSKGAAAEEYVRVPLADDDADDPPRGVDIERGASKSKPKPAAPSKAATSLSKSPSPASATTRKAAFEGDEAGADTRRKPPTDDDDIFAVCA